MPTKATTVQGNAIEPFRHPVISLFQSAVAAVEARMPEATSEPHPGTPAPGHVGPMLQATARAAGTLLSAAPAAAAVMLRTPDDADIVEHCAHAYLALALAEAREDFDAIAAARAALPRDGVCDDRWAEVLEEYILHYKLLKNGPVPYRRWKSMDDFVIDGDALPTKAKVAIISDWGTGQPRAQALLQAIAKFEPDVVIHLGDIYYSCNSREAAAFLQNVRHVFPQAPTTTGKATRVFTLCGNHDMYSGAAPYYDLLDALGQPASFFCLRNAHWQFLAMDTGHNDFDPFQEAKAITWVQDGTDPQGDPLQDAYSELAWHADKLDHAEGRKTILLSHHPLFTRNAPIGGTHAVNERLHAQLAPWLGDLPLWLWGHEHNLVLYGPFAGLQRGRCLGAGAIPTMTWQDIYARSEAFGFDLEVPDLLPDPPAGRLSADPTDPYYDLGFAMVELDGPEASVTYYGFNQTTGPAKLFIEDLLTAA